MAFFLGAWLCAREVWCCAMRAHPGGGSRFGVPPYEAAAAGVSPHLRAGRCDGFIFNPAPEISVKLADKPDSVRLPFLRKTNVTAINLGRGSPRRLNATYPPALRNHINAGLLGIAARRDCPFHPD